MEIRGFVNINKPTGYSSSDVVIKVRNAITRYTGERVKAGHLGTLDPGGAGVLPVAVGKATRLFDYFLQKDKVYRADFYFGKTTDTIDSYGKVIATGRVPSLDEILRHTEELVGDIEQTPPMYSAISVDGRRLYDLAREGKNVNIPKRHVHIYSIDYVGSKSECMHTFDIHCSAGTYIRTIVHDIAERLDTVGYMASIIRLRSGMFAIEDSVTLDEFYDNIERYMIPVEDVLSSERYIDVDRRYSRHILNGIKLDLPRLATNIVGTNIDGDIERYIEDNEFVVKIEGELIGIGEIDERGLLNIPTRLI